MSTHDETSSQALESIGKLKEAAGAITGNKDLEHAGKTDQINARMKNLSAELKDATDKLKEIFNK